MSEGKRPGGLTALAVINFVFGGFNVLGVLGMAAVLALLNVAADAGSNSGDEGMQKVADAWREIGIGLFYLLLALSAINAFLLIASGVGYLKQKRVLGRGLGSVYGLLAIVTAVVMALMVKEEAGGGFSIGTIIGLIYPVLTLILVNTTFKEDLAR
ncbi:MAG: hypothetical protein H6835_08040 [Planctomycetes bacterium]|nr:hypothetical protein [Planctomycetota bacterium]